MSVDQVLVGRIGIAPAGQGNPTIILDSTTGTISGNFTINANTNFNAPNVNASFESLLLSDEDLPPGSTDPRLTVQLGSTNDIVEIDYSGALVRINADTSTPVWFIGFDGSCNFNQVNVGTGTQLSNKVLGLTGPNSGVFINTINNNPNLELYIPDGGGQVALYNSANAGYVWRFTSDGGLSLGSNLTVPGDATVSGNFTCNSFVSIGGSTTTINGLTLMGEVSVAGNIQVNGVVNASQLLVNGVPVTQSVTTYVVNSQGNPANIFSGPSGDSLVLVNVFGGGITAYNAVLLPVNPPSGTTVTVVFSNSQFGFPIVQTTSPAINQFRGQGSQLSQVNLTNIRGGASAQSYVTTFTFVNYGGVSGDDWLVTVS